MSPFAECRTGNGINLGSGPLYCTNGPEPRAIPFSVRHSDY